MEGAAERIYRLKVTLRETAPPVWRRLELAGRTSLRRLHRILQVAMGWRDAHLYLFTVRGELYGEPDGMWEDDGIDVRDAGRLQLERAAPAEGDAFVYEYDLGDGWEHDVVVERIGPPRPWATYPLCVGGARACPPEDCGGTGGYEELLRVIRDPRDEEYESTMTWLGGAFDPKGFDLNAVNRALHGRREFRARHVGRG